MKTDSQISFFIVGVGRSGTSLLQSIISSHSKIAIPPETGFIRNEVLSWKKEEDVTFGEYLNKNERLERVQEVLQNNKDPVYKTELDFYIAFLKSYLEKQNKFLVGDKDPRLIEFIDVISNLFTEVKFIHLVRDPRDVLLSKKKAEWSKGKPSWYHIFANYVQLKMGEWQGQKLPEDRYVSITYENLLAEPVSTIEKICDFLDVEFEKSMLYFQDKAKELVSEDEKQWKKETLGPLLKNNTSKWKGKLSKREVLLTERLCRQAFEIGRYERSKIAEGLSWTEKVWLSIQTAFFRISGFLYIGWRFLSQKMLVKWKY